MHVRALLGTREGQRAARFTRNLRRGAQRPARGCYGITADPFGISLGDIWGWREVRGTGGRVRRREVCGIGGRVRRRQAVRRGQDRKAGGVAKMVERPLAAKNWESR
jgi:hypothetical protein